MSDTTLEVLNRRICISVVRQEAARIGVDAEALLDSQRFYSQLSGLDPDEPGFPRQIRNLVEDAAGRSAGTATGGSRQQPQQQQEAPLQWTLDDVKKASGSELSAAIDAGLLRDMGVGTKKRRR